MAFWKFLNTGKNLGNNLRKIKTIRGQKSIDKARLKGFNLLHKKVEPFTVTTGKYCLLKNKLFGTKHKIVDFRDSKYYSDKYEIIKDWTYLYHEYKFPPKAAYLIPDDIQEGETVEIEDLIENFLEYTYNQGGSGRLKSARAVWEDNDLKILFNPAKDVIHVVG